jgi:hypothetical protein
LCDMPDDMVRIVYGDTPPGVDVLWSTARDGKVSNNLEYDAVTAAISIFYSTAFPRDVV